MGVCLADPHDIIAQLAQPEGVEQISPAWLTAALREGGAIKNSNVVRVEKVEFHHLPSYFSTIAKLKVEYDGHEPHAPATLIVKTKHENAAQRAYGRQFGVFLREIRFYREIAQSAKDINLPICYFSWLDDPTGDGMILLEDLSYLECGDQLAGLSYQHVAATTEMIGRFHALWWDSPKLDQLSWAPLDSYTIADQYGAHWPKFVHLYDSHLSQNSLRIGEAVSTRMHSILNRAKSRPHTLVHCDLRADNLLLDPADPLATVILDWQLIGRGLATFDLVRLICESIELGADAHKKLVTDWHATILDRGVQNYSFEDAWSDYELALALALYIPVINASVLARTSDRATRLIDTMVQRYFHCAEMLQLDKFLERI